jgi:bifunctional N-acetylglucosamine-1-phosphate-uridyltransferase/glucosamine-1-phosphate-acetyltransferase GlmU-like protein
MDRVLIVPAAGRGRRLGASVPKALVPVAGRPMLERVLALHAPTVNRVVVVAAPDAHAAFEQFAAGCALPVDLAIQREATGMLDAVLQARALVLAARPARVLVSWCDQIAVAPGTIARLAARTSAPDAPALAFPTFILDTPYIHFDRDGSGRIVGVRQRREGDTMPERGETDLGLFDLSTQAYGDELPRFASAAVPGSGTGERNFLPFIPWLAARQQVETVAGESAIESLGINTPDDLQVVEHFLAGARGHR